MLTKVALVNLALAEAQADRFVFGPFASRLVAKAMGPLCASVDADLVSLFGRLTRHIALVDCLRLNSRCAKYNDGFESSCLNTHITSSRRGHKVGFVDLCSHAA